MLGKRWPRQGRAGAPVMLAGTGSDQKQLLVVITADRGCVADSMVASCVIGPWRRALC
jgi:hypothetical protein